MIARNGCALALSGLAVLVGGCASGGGGSGPSTGGPPALSGPAGCVRPGCTAGPTTYVASAALGNSNGSRFVYSAQAAPGEGATVTVSPGPTSAAADDVYTINYSVFGYNYSQAFTGLVAGGDGLGSFRKASGPGTDGQTGELFLYDFGTTFGGSLDFVQLGGWARGRGTTNPEFGYFAYGRETLTGAMPTTGSATFTGRARGHGSTGTVLFETASDVRMTANFATGNIDGQVYNFQTQNFPIANPSALDFDFTASILSGGPRFSGAAQSVLPTSAGGIGLQGGVSGSFYGADGAAPDEAAFGYMLDNTLVRIFGAAVLQKN